MSCTVCVENSRSQSLVSDFMIKNVIRIELSSYWNQAMKNCNKRIMIFLYLFVDVVLMSRLPFALDKNTHSQTVQVQKCWSNCIKV